MTIVLLVVGTWTFLPTPASAQCIGPERIGKTLGLYENDGLGEGVRTGPFSGRVPIRKPQHVVLEDSTPAQLDELVDCDGSTFVVYTRETSPVGRVLLWFSLAWLALVIGGTAGAAAGIAMGRRRLMRTGEESAAFPIGGALIGAILAGFGAYPPIWVVQPGTVTMLPPRPVEHVDTAHAVNDPATEEEFALDCAETAMCRRNGDCALVDGECRPTAEEHCANSEDCQEMAACSFVDGACVATEEDCRAWDKCATEALCSFAEGACVRTEEDCRESTQCAELGKCSLVDGKCAPATDDDCRQSQVCKRLKRKDRKNCGLVRQPLLNKTECGVRSAGTELQRTIHDLDPMQLPNKIPGFGGN